MLGEVKATPSPKGQPKFLVLSADDLAQDDVEILREHVRLTRIRFVFPEGLNELETYEEARVLGSLEDFDVMYDLTMQYLAGKSLAIMIKDDDGTERCLGQCRVIDKFTDLRIMPCIADFPYLVHWLVEFLAGKISKRFPLPLPKPISPAAEKNEKKMVKKMQKLLKKES